MGVEISAEDLVHSYGDRRALDGVTLRVGAGSVTALVGESGSGKTTLLRAFNRMVEPDRGSVLVGGLDVRRDPAELLRRRVGYVPQHGGLLPHWTVRRNVALVPRLNGTPTPNADADDALRRVGLDPSVFGDRLPRELSGGQRQRAALARAFAARQELVLLDEPFGALDAISRAGAHEAFAGARQELGFTGLLVTHDLAEAARLADTIVVMQGGRIEQAGSAAELQRNPATPYVQKLFEQAKAAHASLTTAQ
jgi:osmoprotectant transport system ATP-binding protein